MKTILKLSAILFLGTTTLISCGGGQQESTSNTEQVAEKEYYCPMKCEGEKTYPEAGTCPTCGMNLVEKE